MTITANLWVRQAEISQRYIGGEGTSSIAKDFNCNPGTIYLFVRDQLKLPLRPGRKNYGGVKANKDKLIAMFNEGKSLKAVAKEFGFSDTSVMRCLKEWGIDTSRYSSQRADKVVDHLEEIVTKYEAGATMQEIAAELNTNSGCISQLFQRKGIKARSVRKYSMDEAFFEKIDSEEKAYVLGWMYSDGNVRAGGLNRLQIADYDILVKINAILKNETPIRRREPPKKYPHRKVQWLLTFTSVKMSGDLIKLGCVPAKSLILNFPTSDQVPDHLVRHFMRGYMDGDGSICFSALDELSASMVGTENFILGFLRHFRPEKFSIGCRHPERNSTTRDIKISAKRDLKTFLLWLYTDATVYLDRKYLNALWFLTDEDIWPEHSKLAA